MRYGASADLPVPQARRGSRLTGTPQNQQPLSIHLLPPLETGGVEAREGFDVQDHVGVGFCIQMLKTPELQQVWCENQDDLTLIWQRQANEEVEFVQVKSNEPDQLWSIAMLCNREKKAKNPTGLGTSILERSLAYDRCCEPCRFRLVTCRPIKDELKLLGYPLHSAYRQNAYKEVQELETAVGEYVGDFLSGNKHRHTFWLSATYWDVRHSLDAVKNQNLLQLQGLIEEDGEPLFSDQLEELYCRLLAKLRTAASARWDVNSAEKKILRDDLLGWFQEAVTTLRHPVAPGGVKALQQKLHAAGLATDIIETALGLRREYRKESLTPKYTNDAGQELIKGEVSAVLLTLRSRLDAGNLEDSGVLFHSRCLEELGKLHVSLPLTPHPPLAIVCGCMYAITDRCGHRFRRATG
jgi:Cap4, dsDNA endonuclease domain